jgi:hypothetical protein
MNFRPTCPHCDYEFDDEETWYAGTGRTVNTGDCDESELVCPNLDCKKEFKVVCVHQITFEHIEELE